MRYLLLFMIMFVSIGMAHAEVKPSFVVILTDDMALGEFDYMPKTKELIAEAGIEFRRYYHGTDLCCPSRTSLMSGRKTWNHRVLNNDIPTGGAFLFFRSPVRRDTVGVWLQKAGYKTAYIGKFLNGYLAGMGTPPGWERTWLKTKPASEAYDYTVVDDGKLHKYGHATEDYFLYRQRAVVGKFLKSVRNQPFLVYVTPPFPHEEATPAPDHLNDVPALRPLPPSVAEADRSDKPEWVRSLPLLSEADLQESRIQRWRCLQGLDDMVSGILGDLKDLGRLDDTFVLFLTDNGYHAGEHGIPDGKLTGYEESAHGRLYVRGPNVPAGLVSQSLVGSSDIAVTIADLAGVPSSPEVDGRSLAPLITGAMTDADWPRRAYAFEAYGGSRDGNNEAYPLARSHYFGLVTADGEKIVKDKVKGFIQYYKLDSDPYEMTNLYGASTKTRVGRLLEYAVRFRTCKRQSCRTLEETIP